MVTLKILSEREGDISNMLEEIMDLEKYVTQFLLNPESKYSKFKQQNKKPLVTLIHMNRHPLNTSQLY